MIKRKHMTVRKHIMNYMKHLIRENIATFKTSDIQNLSERSTRFTKTEEYDFIEAKECNYKQYMKRRLGSPGTYERMFRELRKSGMITVRRHKEFKKQRQASWYLENIGETNENKS